jgi:hypothetical protein
MVHYLRGNDPPACSSLEMDCFRAISINRFYRNVHEQYIMVLSPESGCFSTARRSRAAFRPQDRVGLLFERKNESGCFSTARPSRAAFRPQDRVGLFFDRKTKSGCFSTARPSRAVFRPQDLVGLLFDRKTKTLL